MAVARDLRGTKEHVVALAGDAAFTNGISFEALNNISDQTNRMIVVLNDNEWSIDRNVGAGVAMLTSVRVMLKNPVTMALWGLMIAVLLVVGSLPLFIGLAIVMPVLGHGTWRFYRRAVLRDRAHEMP